MSTISKAEIYSIAEENAELLDIDLALILAVITVESNFDTFAHRYEPQWHYYQTDTQISAFAHSNGISVLTERIDEATSFGLMQIMGSVARELGFLDKLPELFLPERGLRYGCLKLSQLLKKYPDQSDAISAYNQGSPRRVAGMYANADYVAKVMNACKKIRGE